jgi:carbonic anhydrase/acetyltransferase-like protein (isoleucine patch superfamily)
MSWKQYGGINKLDKLNNISVNTVSTDSLIIREPILGNLDICGNVVIDGSLVIHNYLDIKKNSLFEGNVLMSRNLDISKNVVIDGNLTVGGLLTTNNTLILQSLGINVDFDVSRNTTLRGNTSLYKYVFFDFSNSSVFLKGNSASNNLGLNVAEPQSTLDICGNSISSLNVFSSNEFTRNVLVQNQNSRGISIFSNTQFSGIQFYNDGTLNNSLTDIGSEDYKNRGALIKYDTSGGTLTIDVSNNTVMKTRLAISNRGLNTADGHILNETVAIYDISSAPSTELNPYLYDIYNNNTESTGNALSLITKDSSSNTFINIITPQKKGMNIGGGAYPNDQTRSMGVISYLDVSGRPIPSLMMVSGNNSALNRSTIGINTYAPRTEKYAFNVNGPVHITNGQVNKIVKAGFEITQLSAMNTFGNTVIAVGKPSYIGNNSPTNPYKQNIYYSNNGGQNWNLKNIGSDIPGDTNFYTVYRELNGIYTYSPTFSIAVGTGGYIFDTSNGGVNWNVTGINKSSELTSVYVDNSYVYVVDISNIYIYDSTIFLNEYPLTRANTRTINVSANTLTSGNGYTINTTVNTFNQIKANPEKIFIAGGNGVSVYSKIAPFTPISNFSTNNYNAIDVSLNNIVAVGANIISYSTNGGENWGNITTSSITFNSVVIVDSSNAITVGGNNIYYSNNGYSSWQPVPYDILNSSGNAADLLNSANNFKSITMTTNKSTFLISSTMKTGNNETIGQSSIYYCFLPNLFNRVNNNVFDVCGNMHLAGDITIDNNLYANGGVESTAPSSGTIVVSGGVGISGNTNIGGNTNITKNTTMGGNLTVNANTVSTSIGTGSLIIKGGAGISGNVNIGGETHIDGNTLMKGNLMVVGNCSPSDNSSYQLFVAGNTDSTQRISIGYNQNQSGGAGYIQTIGGTSYSPLYINSLGTAASNQDTYIGNEKSTVYIKGTLILEGDPTAVSAVDVSGSFSINNNLIDQKNIDDYQLYCTGTTSNGGNAKSIFIGYVIPSNNAPGYGSIQTCIGNLSGTASANTIDNFSPLLINTIGNASNPQNTTIGHAGSYVQIGGNMFVINDASLSGNLLVAQDVSMNKRLFLGGDASLNGNLSVKQDVSFNRNFYLSGDASFNGNLSVNQDASLNKNFYLGGDASLNGNLSVNQDVSFNRNFYLRGDASLNGNLSVKQDASFNRNFYLRGDASLNGNLSVNQDVSFNRNFYLGGNASLNGNLSVNQDASFNRNFFLGGNASLKGNISVNQDASFNRNFYLRGDASLNGNLYVERDVSFNRNFSLTRDAFLNGKLFVSQDASLNGNITIGLNAKVDSDLIVMKDSSLNGEFSLQGNAWISKNLTLGQDADISGALTVDLDTTMSGNLIGTNSLKFLSWNGDVSFNRSLFLGGDASLNRKLFVAQDASFNGNISVKGTGNFNSNVIMNNNWINFNTGNGSNNGYGINWANSTSRIYDNGNMHIYTDDGLYFDISGTNNTKMYIDSNGNVGIGTTTPSYTLDVSGNSRFSNNIICVNTISGNLTSTGTSNFNIINGNAISGNLTSTGTSAFNNLTANTISGNLTSTGTSAFNNLTANTISGNLTSTGNSIINNLTANTISGNLTSTGTSTFNNISATTINENGTALSTKYALINGNATFTTVTAQSFNATSDYRIKEIIEPLNANYTIDNLTPIHYKNKLTDKEDIGFLAHDVQEFYPFLVSGNKDENNENGEPKYQSINYNGLIGLLVNEIQILKKEIKEIKEKTGL